MSDAPIVIDDCWNRIGVYGAQSCARLAEHHHCRHCDVYGDAARQLMKRAIPIADQEAWTRHIAEVPISTADLGQSALVFRLGAEWLALPSALFVHAAEPVKAHRIPHRNNPALLGIVNVRGQVYPCVSLLRLLGIAEGADHSGTVGRRSFPRLLLARLGRQTYALPVTEVYGMHRYAAKALQDVPTTVSSALQPLLQGVLEADGNQVGLLDAQRTGVLLAECLR